MEQAAVVKSLALDEGTDVVDAQVYFQQQSHGEPEDEAVVLAGPSFDQVHDATRKVDALEHRTHLLASCLQASSLRLDGSQHQLGLLPHLPGSAGAHYQLRFLLESLVLLLSHFPPFLLGDLLLAPGMLLLHLAAELPEVLHQGLQTSEVAFDFLA
jgi:hypothetical protein